MEEVKCYMPQTLAEALQIRKETGAQPLAGGSDLMVANSRGAGIVPGFKKPILIISNLPELKGIRRLDDGTVEIGALSTSWEIHTSPVTHPLLKDAASRMGAVALRNSATIGGNIGNASPKGDMPQPLILLDAEVVLQSVDGERRMKVDDFIIKTKVTAIGDDELITKVVIPPQEFTHIFFRKIGMRRSNAISKLTLSAAANIRDGVVADFRASSGAAGPKVERSRAVESLLIGHEVAELPTLKGAFLDAWCNDVIAPHAMPEYRRNATRRIDGELAGANLAVLSQSGHAARCVDRELADRHLSVCPQPRLFGKSRRHRTAGQQLVAVLRRHRVELLCRNAALSVASQDTAGGDLVLLVRNGLTDTLVRVFILVVCLDGSRHAFRCHQRRSVDGHLQRPAAARKLQQPVERVHIVRHVRLAGDFHARVRVRLK